MTRKFTCYNCPETFNNAQGVKAHQRFCKGRTPRPKTEEPTMPDVPRHVPRHDVPRHAPKALESGNAGEKLEAEKSMPILSSSSFSSSEEEKKALKNIGTLISPDVEPEPETRNADIHRALSILSAHRTRLTPGFPRDLFLKAEFQFSPGGSQRLSKMEREKLLELAYVMGGSAALQDADDSEDKAWMERAWHPLRVREPNHDTAICNVCKESRDRAAAASALYKQEMREMYDRAVELGTLTPSERDTKLAELETI